MVKHKKNKRKKGALEFCFVAPDIVTTAAIEDEAQKHGIPLYRKGHSRHHVYANCNHPKWRQFYSQIANRAVEISRVPAWLERQIHNGIDQNKGGISCRTCNIKTDSTMLKTASPPKSTSNHITAAATQSHSTLNYQPQTITPFEKIKVAMRDSLRALLQRCTAVVRDVKNWLRFSSHAHGRIGG
jgi:hypothetical protein